MYRAERADALRGVELPPFTALYHRASGITHLLTEPAPEILAALGHEPLTLTELTARLSQRFDLADPAALPARLDELIAAGLVEAL